ncbi:MAG: PH domain-containing protein [Clostridia bacterium]|nr:PH domain-containing protein [Clostridia bacterium]
MIDFKNPEFVKLKEAPNAFNSELMPLLVDGEQIISSYKSIRDGVAFTNKRIFVINIQGMTGKKKDITSLPFSKVQAFSTETAGVLDMDSELELWFSGLGKVKLEFAGNTDIGKICKLISDLVL